MELMKDEFGKDMDLTITRGKVHDYLGIRINFSKKGKVIMMSCSRNVQKT
jgi:hypothetical protein